MFSVYFPPKMPACAAKGCCNSSGKKVKMNCFPTDPDRRKAWVSQCVEFGNITNWTPKDNPGKSSGLKFILRQSDSFRFIPKSVSAPIRTHSNQS